MYGIETYDSVKTMKEIGQALTDLGMKFYPLQCVSQDAEESTETLQYNSLASQYFSYAGS